MRQKPSGDAVGTAMYMAPETALGAGDAIGPAADVYSLGAVLYELIAGQPPWPVKSAAELVERLRGPSPPPPSTVRRVTADDLDRICLRCLGKVPSERYASIRQLREDLQAFIDDKPPAHLLPLTAKKERTPRVLRWLGLGAIVGVLAILLGLSGKKTDSLAATAEARAQSHDRLSALDMTSQAVGRGNLNEAKLILRSVAGSANRPDGSADGVEQFLRRQLDEAVHLHTFTGDGSKVQALSVSPDGQYLAAGDEHGMVRIWNLDTRQLVQAFKDRDGEIRGLGFSPTRAELAVTGMTGVVNLWRTNDWTPLATRAVPSLTRTCLSWRGDGDLLVTGARDGTIELLEWPDLKMVKDWHEGDVIDAIQLSGSRFWYTCRDHFPISTRSTRDPTTRTDVLIGSSALFGFAIDPGRSFGLYEDGLFALDGSERVHPSLRRTVRAVAISGDGKWGVTCGGEGFVDVFQWKDPFTRFSCDSFRGHPETATAVAVCPDHQHFLTASDDGSVRLWSLDSLAEPTETQCHGIVHTVRDICLDSDGHRFAMIGDYGVMHVDEQLDPTVRELKETGKRRVMSAGFQGDSKTLLIHRMIPEPGIEVLDPDRIGPAEFIEIPNLALASFSQGRGVALVLTGTRPFVECREASDLTTAVTRFAAPGPVSAIAYDHAAKVVLLTYRAGGEWHCRITDCTGDRNLGDWVLGPERPERILFSPRQSRCFLVAGGTIGFEINIASSDPPERVSLCEAPWRVAGAACAPDGRTLAFVATSSRDEASECFLWDRGARCRFLTMAMPDAQAGAVQFINGGQRVVVGSHSFKSSGLASLRSWNLAPRTDRSTSDSGH